jgi:hypothetical protein
MYASGRVLQIPSGVHEIVFLNHKYISRLYVTDGDREKQEIQERLRGSKIAHRSNLQEEQ